ncbi:hypothetical protein L905_17700 [Agrobacterium sp. TS43]|nr:hypothetical protein L902_23495 [Agrobacterium radiobacter DSM 30147]KVK43996.1 hypothetical protein L904_08785 [Agrobacterium sp. LY4]KVK44376.1 hypothetical protein L903_08830 [Agrobacterium sp. JL28]KVK58259.1 hypothetical protein L906_08750 [Agrobacterium sp. TS45]KVK62304.1 hypothetical protein L907_08780 [Agrobacterium sp. C13]KVK66469.1 hypothetical protein L905_17700 [Agrobacterium sp. TS43]
MGALHDGKNRNGRSDPAIFLVRPGNSRFPPPA